MLGWLPTAVPYPTQLCHTRCVCVCVCCLVVSSQRHACEFGKRGSSHSIAWAFLRLSGLQHRQLVQGQPLKLKLQLYEYSPGAGQSVQGFRVGALQGKPT